MPVNETSEMQKQQKENPMLVDKKNTSGNLTTKFSSKVSLSLA
jgi:hypothetical protein